MKIQKSLIVVSFSFLLGSCASVTPEQPRESQEEQAAEVVVEVAPEPKKRPKPHEYPVAPFQRDALYELLVAEVAGYRGEYETALEKYMEMAEETRDAGVAARATRLANYLKRSDLALKAAQIWADVDPDSIDAHRHSADQLMRAGDLEGAVYHMEAVKNLGGLANFDVFAYRAANLDEASRESLLNAISKLLEKHPADEQLQFAKAVLLEQKGELEQALELADRLLADKQNKNVIILKVNALKDLHRSDDAVAFLKDIVEGTSGDSRRLRLIFARLLFETRQLDKAREQYEFVLKQAPNDGDVLLALAFIAMEQSNDTVAIGYLKQMIRWNRRVGEAHFYLGSIAEKNKDVPKAIREYRQVGRGYEFLPAQSRIANLMVTQGRISEMRTYLANMRADNPERANQLVMIEARLLSDRGMLKEGMDLLDRSMEHDPENIDLLYFRAMTGQKFGFMDVLERDLKQIIDLDPQNSDAMNALGYTLADQTDRHEEALQLIQRALAIKPDEAAFIDSMGWVLYRLKKFDEALVYLRRALELFTNDEVAAHLGEVLWAIGEKTEAREVWQKALELKPDSEILNRVIKEFTGQ